MLDSLEHRHQLVERWWIERRAFERIVGARIPFRQGVAHHLPLGRHCGICPAVTVDHRRPFGHARSPLPGMYPTHNRAPEMALGSVRLTQFYQKQSSSTHTRGLRKGVVVETAIQPSQVAKPPRHKVTGDVHLLLRRGNRVLFGQRQNTGFEDGAWHLPSGHLEADESVVDALIREAEEEVGVEIRPEDVHFAHVMHNSSSGGRMAFFFSVDAWDGDPVNQEPDKCSELDWFSLNALPDHLIAYCRTALDHIAADEQFSVYGW
ncbi:NUDIX hydrolase [Nocardia sp. NPDC004722]